MDATGRCDTDDARVSSIRADLAEPRVANELFASGVDTVFHLAAIVSGQHDVPYYAEAFGIPEDRVVPTGIPRMDRFFDASTLGRVVVEVGSRAPK